MTRAKAQRTPKGKDHGNDPNFVCFALFVVGGFQPRRTRRSRKEDNTTHANEEEKESTLFGLGVLAR
jgi:hypothetical protein